MAIAAQEGGVQDRRSVADRNAQGRPAWWVRLLAALPWWVMNPLADVLAWLSWLVLVIGWFADDSGVLVPAVALPFVIPLTVAMASAVSVAADGARYFGTAFAGSSVAGRPPR